ncbi:MAG: GTP cyclohydrolase IIa, partial [Halanaeroarchaeum sp.]
FSTFIEIEQGYASLMRHLHDEHGSLAFFVGGDNVIAITSGMGREAFAETIDYVKRDADVELQVGVGSGTTSHDAGMAAKHGLEACRAKGTKIEGDVS